MTSSLGSVLFPPPQRGIPGGKWKVGVPKVQKACGDRKWVSSESGADFITCEWATGREGTGRTEMTNSFFFFLLHRTRIRSWTGDRSFAKADLSEENAHSSGLLTLLRALAETLTNVKFQSYRVTGGHRKTIYHFKRSLLVKIQELLEDKNLFKKCTYKNYERIHI